MFAFSEYWLNMKIALLFIDRKMDDIEKVNADEAATYSFTDILWKNCQNTIGRDS